MKPMGSLWEAYAKPMGSPCGAYELLRSYHRLLTGYLLATHETPMRYVWATYGMSLGYPSGTLGITIRQVACGHF